MSNDKTVVQSFSVTVPERTIDTLIEMAGYGIDYWVSTAVIDSEAGTYTVVEDEDGTEHVISYYKLAETLIRVALDPSLGLRDDIVGYAFEWFKQEREGDEFAAGEIDSDLADVVVQIAAFGEVIYG
jgi:hypothetical protein